MFNKSQIRVLIQNVNYYFIARCTLIPQVAALMLSRVT